MVLPCLNLASVMAKMGVVFQQSTLDIDLTVKQNLSLASLHGISTTSALSLFKALDDSILRPSSTQN